MRRGWVFTFFAAAGVLTGLYAASGFSRTASEVVSGSTRVVDVQQPPRPTFRTEANYVRVDVYPTQGGAPVLDLMQSDFEVLESGTAQTIDAFEHVLITGGAPQET